MSKRERRAVDPPIDLPASTPAPGEAVPAAPNLPELAGALTPTNEPPTMQLIQEHLDVSKQWVEAGAVVIKKVAEIAPVTVPVELAHDEVESNAFRWVACWPTTKRRSPGKRTTPGSSP